MIELTTFKDLCNALENNNKLFGAIIFSSKGWNEREGGYPLTARTYIFSGDNKAFGDYAGYSCFASDLAGIDRGIRLEQYWGKWEKLACYVIDKDNIDKFKDMIRSMEA